MISLARQHPWPALLASGVLLCALTAGLISLRPQVAAAAPSAVATSSAIEQKRAEEAEARAQLEQTRIDLAILVSEYIEMSSEMVRTKDDIAKVSADLITMKLELDEAERALTARAIELYRGDRETMVSLIFSAKTLQDLWVRSAYLAKINLHDARLVNEVRLARSENLWLQQGLYDKAERLQVLQRSADDQRSRIESDLAAQEARAVQLRVDLARLMWSPGSGSSAPQGGFSPDTVISEAQFRDAAALTVEQIQAFLDEQPGSLATYKALDHAGAMKTTAQIVAEAARAWGVNPKVLLVKLQKEQSLLQRAHPTQNAYDWAMGCGKTDSRTFTKYKGFGKQIWFGAEKLAKNGGAWYPGITMKIDGSVIHPTNAATYSLFKYTPHFRGTMSFWMLYWRYFGDPLV